jgi:hypothetical protein
MLTGCFNCDKKSEAESFRSITFFLRLGKSVNVNVSALAAQQRSFETSVQLCLATRQQRSSPTCYYGGRSRWLLLLL